MNQKYMKDWIKKELTFSANQNEDSYVALIIIILDPF